LNPFDTNGLFKPVATGGGGLRQRAVRGAGVTVLSGGLTLSIQIFATVVLARLLTPKDFGLVTMVTTFSLLLMNFGLNGFTEAVVQREEMDQVLASNLFWINLSGGLLLATGFAAAGSSLAWFYRDPQVARVAAVMSMTIFLTSASVLHLALLKRAMCFHLVSANDIVARAVSVVMSILLGFAGWGYWALVAGAIALAMSTCVGAWILCRWVPNLPRRGVADMRPLVRFAISAYARFSVGYFTNNLDNILIGWRLGPTPLGFYKKAYDLFVLPTSQLSSPLTIVAVSALSRLQRDSIRYKRYLVGALGVMAFVGMGIGADLTLVGKDLIFVLLGPKWGESGRIFTFFGPGIGITLLYGTHQWIHLSIGRADRWLRWGMVDLSVTALFLLVGLRWGPVGIALAWVASSWTITLPALWYAGRPINFGVAPVLAAVWKYIVASLLAGCASAALIGHLPSLVVASGSFWAFARIGVTSVLFGVLYLGVVILLHRGYAPLTQLAGLLREMVSRERSSPAIVATLTSAEETI
jgi:PST family polysaccharide transporter